MKVKVRKSPILTPTLQIQKVKISLSKSVKNSKQLLVLIHDYYFGKFLKSKGFSRIKSSLDYDKKTHTANLHLTFYWKRKLRFWREKKEKAYIRIKVDRGWNWVEVSYYNLKDDNLQTLLNHLAYRLRVLETLKNLWVTYNPSSRKT